MEGAWVHRILWLVVAVVFVVGLAIPDDPDVATGQECPPRDTRVLAPYAVTGYFVIPRADRCVTQRMVEAIHAIGGDTLITFGPRFNARPDPDFPECAVDGRPCAELPGKRVRQVYTYMTSEEFGPGMLRCPGIDRRFESGGRTFYRLTLAGSCADAEHDLVLATTDGDGLGTLVREASAYGMTVYPGLPAAPQREGKQWEPDHAHTGALNAFTARVLADYRQRFTGLAAFGGVYQSFELAMRARAERDPIIELYAAQHAVVAATLPGRKIVVSPYIDARRGRGFPPSQVAEGLADIAGTRAGQPMAVAVQDGRGTGKVPVHGPHEADARVAERLVPVVGDVRNAQGYHGPTSAYIETAAANVPDGVELWVNAEGFEPTPVAGECGRLDPLPHRGRTTKSRLDRQIMAAGAEVAKIISYKWEPFYTCQAGHDTPSLADDIAAGWQQPIIVNAYRKELNGRPGLLVEGYHLHGVTLRFDPQGAVAAQEWHGRERLESAWVPYEPPPGTWTSITATNATGHTSTNPYVMR
ncbi:DUF4434 domain-containing protein [Nonomuraea candida]|uniref:DUF4434 domain-containing protein n=1 Tax=Nonomuraea candida TaxID=359159 RepID=UPI000A7FCAE0|nr:DUF4434 domain-containing protein [Nonomuraea candida]